jgi:hypothetical protein
MTAVTHCPYSCPFYTVPANTVTRPPAAYPAVTAPGGVLHTTGGLAFTGTNAALLAILAVALVIVGWIAVTAAGRWQ